MRFYIPIDLNNNISITKKLVNSNSSLDNCKSYIEIYIQSISLLIFIYYIARYCIFNIFTIEFFINYNAKQIFF